MTKLAIQANSSKKKTKYKICDLEVHSHEYHGHVTAVQRLTKKQKVRNVKEAQNAWAAVPKINKFDGVNLRKTGF